MASPVCPSGKSINYIKMSRSLRRIGEMILTGQNRNAGRKNLSKCHSVHHKSLTELPGVEQAPSRWETRRLKAKAWPRRRKEIEINFLSHAVRIPKQNCFLEGSRASQVCPSNGNTSMKMSMLTEENGSTGRKACPSGTSPTAKSHMDTAGIELSKCIVVFGYWL